MEVIEKFNFFNASWAQDAEEVLRDIRRMLPRFRITCKRGRSDGLMKTDCLIIGSKKAQEAYIALMC